MTDTDYLDEYAPRLLIPSWSIFGKKADLSSEYEDLSSEGKTIIKIKSTHRNKIINIY